MIEITNNWIRISKSEPLIFPITMNFRMDDYLYYADLGEFILIPTGLLSFLQPYIENSEVIDNRVVCPWDSDKIINSISDYREILRGIQLRDEQLTAISRALYFKRGIIQMPTGSGKSEVMCGIIESISLVYGKYPTVLIMEPTITLVNSMVSRFNKYDIPAVSYRENRKIIENCVNICHPYSLSNDIDKDPHILDSVQILIGDESHHFSADQFRRPTYHMPNLVMSIGVSASVISQQHAGLSLLSSYNINEVLAFSATGPLIMNITAGALIDDNRLATPVLLMIDNQNKEYMYGKDPYNWHNVVKYHLESKYRNKLVVDCAQYFSSIGRKSLILVNTVRWSRALLKEFDSRNMSDITRASYGGGRFEYYDGYDFRVDSGDVLSKFGSGEYSVLIGTTHLYEGVDVPNLDVIILAYGGKGERIQVQGIGRALRKTKTGKYAYIVDFLDNNDVILKSHSKKRLQRYRENTNISSDRTYLGIQPKDIPGIISRLEEDV